MGDKEFAVLLFLALASFAMLLASISVSIGASRKVERMIVLAKSELLSSVKGHKDAIVDLVSMQQREVSDRLNHVNTSLRESLVDMMRSNQESLEKINDTVNEKLQQTLDVRLSKSFESVRMQLSEVDKGLGEMKNLASGVKDLQGVLSNVKTRGILGEYQLEAILSEMLTRDQYEAQLAVTPGSSERVDFAIKLPGHDSAVYLPVDSKFPGETYAKLSDAICSGDKASIEAARKSLRSTILQEAKSISDKYIDPPYTTDFAVMFLPVEGLYAEVVNMGILPELQRKYSVTVAGPSTMSALLAALRMGFRTLAIEKKSGEAWKVLEAVKKEFSTFETVLVKARERISQADSELEQLVGVRSRAIIRKLKNVSSTESFSEADKILGIEDGID